MSVESDQFDKKAVHILVDLLKEVPFLHVNNPMGPYRKPGEIFPNDGIVKVDHKNGSRYLVLEVKKNAQLRDIRNFVEIQHSVDRIERFARNMGAPGYGVFASQYLTPASRDYCKENGVGYFDLSGNCRLAFDEVYIEKEKPLSIAPEKKRLRSMFSEKSARVIRRLLECPQRAWGVQNLAGYAEVSIATVSLLKEKLLAEGYAERRGEGFFINNPESLLLDWARHYSTREHVQLECYLRGELDQVEIELTSGCTQNFYNFAFTLFSAAKRIAPFTRGVQRTHVYVEGDEPLTKIAEKLKLKPVDSGGNVRIIDPGDHDLLFGLQSADGMRIVSDVQLYLDLSGHKGRGEENAEYLLEQRIKPKWQKSTV
jgi:hypothetical protein